MKESDIQSAIIKYLRTLPAAYVINHHGGPMATVGVPDLLVCYRGRFIGLEVKMPGKEATAIQLHHYKLIQAASGVAGTVSSIHEVKYILEYVDSCIDTRLDT